MNYQEYMNKNNEVVPVGFVNVLAEIAICSNERTEKEGPSWISNNANENYLTPNDLLELSGLALIALSQEQEQPEQFISKITNVRLFLTAARNWKAQ